MIVKDESKVIRRCLESVKPMIDAWAIVDTGSTDSTKEIILDCLKGIPGELSTVAPPKKKWWQKRQLFDFAKHRNIALDAARKLGTDYVLLIDADEEIALSKGATWEVPHLDADRYVAQFRNMPDNRVWHRSILIKSSVPWYWKHSIHETLHCDISDPLVASVLGGLEVKSYSDGGRNQNPVQKYLNDAAACREAIKAEPDEPRHWFYLGQSYASAGQFLKAFRAYERRIAIGGGWDEEVWYSLYQLAPLGQLMGYHWRDTVAAYLKAYNARPWRAEPLWAAGCICRDNGEPALGEVYLRHALRLEYPPDSFLIDQSVYNWRSADDLCGCLAMTGQKEECLQILENLSESERLPKAELTRVLENIEKAKAA